MSSVDLDSDLGCAPQAIEMGDVRPTMQTDTFPMETEMETLKALDEACIKHVPRLEYDDDLPEPLMCVAKFERNLSRCGSGRVGSRGCNQLVGDSSFAGVPQEKVRSSRMILEVIRRAFIARQQMLERCGAPHCGSSGGNIADRTGALSDWGLAGRVRAGGRRRRDRTGTYQFMSYKLVMDPKSKHELQDDLESFFWVMVYHNLRYLQYAEGVSLEFRQTTMKIVFGSTRNSYDNLAGREWGKVVFLSDSSFRPRLECRPMRKWVNTIAEMVKAWADHAEERKFVTQARLLFEDLPDPSIVKKLVLYFEEPSLPNEIKAHEDSHYIERLLNILFPFQPPTSFRNHQKMDRVLKACLNKYVWPRDDVLNHARP